MNTMVLDASSPRQWVAMLGEAGNFAVGSSENTRALPGLFRCIDACARQSQTAIADVSRLAVVTGPGSWTGIQCALAAARSFALYGKLPLLPLSKLDLLIYDVDSPKGHPVAALLAAGNGLAYGAAYSHSTEGKLTKLFTDRLTLEEWCLRLTRLEPACVVATEEPLEKVAQCAGLTAVERPFHPSEHVLRLALARSTPLVDAKRFDFEPLFLHDPNPRPWAPQV